MQFRPAKPADGPAYLDLVRSLAAFEKLAPPDGAACERLLTDAFGERPRYQLWVAEEAAQVVAYAATFETYSTFLARPSLYLEDLFVHPDARKRGIGTQMLEQLEQVARARGCGRFEWSVLDWNTDAQKVYQQFGAELLKEWRIMRVTL